jgi:hypothetical protein
VVYLTTCFVSDQAGDIANIYHFVGYHSVRRGEFNPSRIFSTHLAWHTDRFVGVRLSLRPYRHVIHAVFPIVTGYSLEDAADGDEERDSGLDIQSGHMAETARLKYNRNLNVYSHTYAA